MDDEDDLSTDDLGGFNESLRLAYIFDATMTQYYGVAALDVGGLSGYSLEATTGDDAQLFEALTTEVEIADEPAERAAVTGVGPYDIAAGRRRPSASPSSPVRVRPISSRMLRRRSSPSQRPLPR